MQITRWVLRLPKFAFVLSLVAIGMLAWHWWVPPVTGDDIMANGYLYAVFMMPWSARVSGLDSLLSTGLIGELTALVLLSVYWTLLGVLFGWLIDQFVKRTSAARAA